MREKDDREKEEELLSALLQVGLTLFGKPDPAKVAKRKRHLQILDSLEYPGGKRVH